jgi:hypothetical protein
VYCAVPATLYADAVSFLAYNVIVPDAVLSATAEPPGVKLTVKVVPLGTLTTKYAVFATMPPNTVPAKYTCVPTGIAVVLVVVRTLVEVVVAVIVNTVCPGLSPPMPAMLDELVHEVLNLYIPQQLHEYPCHLPSPPNGADPPMFC